MRSYRTFLYKEDRCLFLQKCPGYFIGRAVLKETRGRQAQFVILD